MPASSRPALLPGATGLLLALAFPPLHLVVPSFVALAPLAVHLDREGTRGGSAAGAFRAGSVAGAVAWGLLLAWMPPALLPWSWLALPGYVLAVAALAGLTGAVAAAFHGLRSGAGVPVALALPLAWTAGEWVRGHLPGPLAFPWLGLGTSLTGRPEWVGIAEVVGERGVTFWLAAVSALLAAAWRSLEGRPEPGTASREGGGGVVRAPGSAARAVRVLAAALILAVAVPMGGIVRARSLETHSVARVAVVQPNVTRRTHPDPAAMRRAVQEALERLARDVEAAADRGFPGGRAAAGSATDAEAADGTSTGGPATGRPRGAGGALDLVVLPEALFPDTLGGLGSAGAEARLAAFALRVGAPVLVGALTVSGGAGDGVVHNSVVLVDGGERTGWRYDKHHLVPLVERLPLLPVPGVGEGFAGYGPGRGWPVAPVAPGLDVGAFVCYESAFAGVSRALVTSGADLLVNVTNDGWFGRPGARTHALWQHPAHLVMRAVETRTGIARAASTGFSFFVDPLGRIEGRSDLFEEAVSVATVSAADGVTPFVRTGDVVGVASLAVTVLLLLAARLRDGWHIGGGGG